MYVKATWNPKSSPGNICQNCYKELFVQKVHLELYVCIFSLASSITATLPPPQLHVSKKIAHFPHYFGQSNNF